MDVFYLLFYRIYSSIQERLARLSPRGLPHFLKRTKRTTHRTIERFLFPTRRLCVRVRSGLSRGLWIRARFPEEASHWRGARDCFTEAAILATVREGSVVYDVGAHIGSVTLGTARLAGATGRVVAFEADPDTVSSLRESCYLNDFEQRVEIIHAAVWSRSERRGILFRRGVSRPSHGGVVADGCQPVLADGPTITVPSTTLDEFVAQHGSTPELIKIDVEGAEYEVLRGGEILFGRDRPSLIVEVHHADALEKINQWIERFRYSAQWNVPKQGFTRMLFGRPTEFPRGL